MKTLKNNALAVISVFMMVLLSVAGVLAVLAGGTEFSRPLRSVIVGAVVFFGMLLVKETYLHKVAPVLYAAIVCVLMVQLCVGDDLNPFSKRYIYISGVMLHTAILLPLTYLLTAKMIGKYHTTNLRTLFFIVLSMAVPVILVFLQSNMTPVIIACAVAYITMIVMKKDKRVNLHWLVYLIPVLLAAAVIVCMCTNYSYLSQRIEIILTRGQNDPLGAGWMRTVLDSIFMNTPFIGATTYSFPDISLTQMLVNWGGHNLMALLAEYGWLVFGAVIAMYICFFVVLFRMVHKTRQSTFARYTSLMLALALLIQSIYCLTGIFLLYNSPVEMPFLSSGFTRNAIAYLSFGIILKLYMDRNKVSAIKEVTYEEAEENSLLSRLDRYIFGNETEDISDDIEEETSIPSDR